MMRASSLHRAATLGLVAMACSLSACDSKDGKKPNPTATTSAALSASAAPSAAPAPRKWRVRIGPPLGILPGVGLSAIRFGANTKTIERIMEAPCTTKTETLCRYVHQAVEFHLENGGTKAIHIHREDRRVPGSANQTFGPFNGHLRKDAKFGMFKEVAQQAMGEPERIEKVDGKSNLHNTVERHHYPGITLEYDLLPNGNTVLGGMLVTQNEATPAASPSDKSAAAPPVEPKKPIH